MSDGTHRTAEGFVACGGERDLKQLAVQLRAELTARVAEELSGANWLRRRLILWRIERSVAKEIRRRRSRYVVYATS